MERWMMGDLKPPSRIIMGLEFPKCKIWRIGLMGETCKIQNVHSLIGALRDIMS